MTADPRSLAGIEGLLLECSPCVLLEHEDVPEWLVGEIVSVGIAYTRGNADFADVVTVWLGRVDELHVCAEAVELDLTHKTGRCHAAWFVDAANMRGRYDAMDEAVLDAARRGCDLPPDGMERLRDLVLLAAGRGDAVASAPTSDR